MKTSRQDRLTAVLSADSGPDVVRFIAGADRSIKYEVRVEGEGLAIRSINPLGDGDGTLQVTPNASNSINVTQPPIKKERRA